MSERKPVHLDDSTVLLGAVIGFFLGAIVWLFHVPKRGKDTRKDIVDNARAMIGQKAEEEVSEEKSSSEYHSKYEYFR